MTKYLFFCAFVLGVLAILWIGRIFLGADSLGLSVTVLIGIVYAIGTWELLTFRRATGSLINALNLLSEPIEDLHQWLMKIDPSLQNAVRIRVEGERNALSAPVVTPYLVGLLVMLGLLGTFVGMVDTLKGAVVALEGTSELEAIRAGLAAPIEGLGLAFGTSVAGVSASAMLGLLSTISRRERLQCSNFLDTKLGVELRHFSKNHQQELAFKAIQDQAMALPVVADQLTALAGNLERMGERIGDRLFENQEKFQVTVTELHKELNKSVDLSLKETLVESAQLINLSIQPVAEATLSQMSETALATQEKLQEIGQQQLSAMVDSANNSSVVVRDALEVGISHQSETTKALMETVRDSMESTSNELKNSSQSLVASFGETSESWLAKQEEQAKKMSESVRKELVQLRDDEAVRGGLAVERLSELQEVVASHLVSLGAALEEPMVRLIDKASQTPKAAAEVIQTLRDEMTKNLERDNDLLSERTRLMEQLDALSSTLGASAVEQRDAVDVLIARSNETLTQVSDQFGVRVAGETSRLADVTEQFASSSAEIASLGDAFNSAVTLFSDSNNQLIENLTRIEASLEKSNNRSDEQLGFYVAQAREIIDHNLLSQKEIIDALRAQRRMLPAAQGAG